jgi:hypothetical protein
MGSPKYCAISLLPLLTYPPSNQSAPAMPVSRTAITTKMLQALNMSQTSKLCFRQLT